MGKLTPGQKHFADEWLIDHNGTRAARVAYPGIKTDNAAAVRATKHLANPKIMAYIAIKQAEAAARYAVSQDRILEEEGYIAFADIAGLFNGPTVLAPEDLPESLRRSISSIKIKETEFDGVTTREYEYKFWDKGRSLERISKHLGMYAEDNKQKGLALKDMFNGVQDISPALAEALRNKIAERLECSSKAPKR